MLANRNRSNARLMREKPVFALIETGSGAALDLVVEYTTPRSILSRLRFESEQEQIFVSDYIKTQQATKPVASNPSAKPVMSGGESETAASAAGSDLSALRMLKFSWQQASPEERAAFLEWTQK